MRAVRKIIYVSGTRADFGLMMSTLERIDAHPDLELGVAVTGMHLSPTYGSTVGEVEALGLRIAARVPYDVEERTGLSMALGVGAAVDGLARAFDRERPDFVLVIGDRGEMLAAAIAALHLGIAVVHLHGGERSGTIDEPVRHAITKLSHWHFVATEESRERVIRMGELHERVKVTGAPSLDGLEALAAMPRDELVEALSLPAGAQYVIVLFHPVVQEADGMVAQTGALLQALERNCPGNTTHVVWLDPNADAGSGEILHTLGGQDVPFPLHRRTHLHRALFIPAVAHARALVGNSSAGIIESASLGTPVVNIGSRQHARERNENTIDCEPTADSISAALARALAHGPFPRRNRYGDGHAGERITQLLATLPLDRAVLHKVNSY
jgi:GDP/UDP-N,N'-diacetylbacillosamine 2-epimerase (hydrolysing)